MARPKKSEELINVSITVRDREWEEMKKANCIELIPLSKFISNILRDYKGQPPEFEQDKSQPAKVRCLLVEKSVWDKVEKEATAFGLKKSQYVVLAVMDFVNHQKFSR